MLLIYFKFPVSPCLLIQETYKSRQHCNDEDGITNMPEDPENFPPTTIAT